MGVPRSDLMVVLEDRHLNFDGIGGALRSMGPRVLMHTVDSRTTSIDDDRAFEMVCRMLEAISSDADCAWHMHFGTPRAQTLIASEEFAADLVMDVEGKLWREVAVEFDGRLCLTRY